MGKGCENRLLITACSQKKRESAAALLPAIDRYDGPVFRILRKYIALRPHEARKLDIYILSARFGLIPANQPIANYDTKMTEQAATKLNRDVLSVMQKLFLRRRHKQLFINAGQGYLHAIAGYESLIPGDLKVEVAAGSLGRRQAELRDWLYGEAPPKQSVKSAGTARIRGVTINLTPEEVTAIAVRALTKTPDEHARYQSWQVPINEYQVAPKWLVSQLTGLPVSNFHSDEARRVLQQLGIEVVRV